MNILASPLPATVDVGGASVPIKTGYRTGIQVARTADSGMPDQLIAGSILRLYFAEHVPNDHAGALVAAMKFHRCGAEVTGSSTPRRLLDWDHDAGMVLADFRREYGIDLADPATRMHWWVFMAYFSNLSASSDTKRALYYRSPKPSGLKGDDAKHFREMARAYALPSVTEQEAADDEAAIWGDV